jgi:hypothetical protein
VPSSEIVTAFVDIMQKDRKATMPPNKHEEDKKCEEIRNI